MTCTLIVATENPGWLSLMAKVLKNLEGCVTDFSLDALHGIATISGKMDSNRILQLLNKVGGEHLLRERVDYGLHPSEIRLKNNQPFYDPQRRELLPEYNNHPSYTAPPPRYPPLPPPPQVLPKYNNNNHPSYNAPPPHYYLLPPPPLAPPRDIRYSADDPDECSIM